VGRSEREPHTTATIGVGAMRGKDSQAPLLVSA